MKNCKNCNIFCVLKANNILIKSWANIMCSRELMQVQVFNINLFIKLL